VAIILFVFAWSQGKIPTFKGDPRGFLSMVNDVAALFVGFIIATITYLLSISDSSAMRFIKQAGKFQLLIWYFVHAGATWFSLCMINLIISAGITAEQWLTGQARLVLLGAWFTLAAYSVGSLCRLLMIFRSLAIFLSNAK
jgi:hypothetical protein